MSARMFEQAEELTQVLADDFAELLKRRLAIATAGGVPGPAQVTAVGMFAERVCKVALGISCVGVPPAHVQMAVDLTAQCLSTSIEGMRKTLPQAVADFESVLREGFSK